MRLIIWRRLTGVYYIKTRARKMSGWYILGGDDKFKIPVDGGLRIRDATYRGSVSDLGSLELDYEAIDFKDCKFCNASDICSDFSTAYTLPIHEGTGFKFMWNAPPPPKPPRRSSHPPPLPPPSWWQPF
jgi:hypothetical protein